MNKLDKVSRFVFRHGSQTLMAGLALFGLIEYLDFNRGFDYVLAVVLVVLLAKEAYGFSVKTQ